MKLPEAGILAQSGVDDMPAQTAPFALAFVAGYATDIFFAVADRLVDELYHLAKGKDKDAKDVKAAADGIQAEPGASGPAPNALAPAPTSLLPA